jgi:hypothetical protein
MKKSLSRGSLLATAVWNVVSQQYGISSEFGADIGSARQGEMSRREQLQRPERLQNCH